jgi:hypothetical protein
VTGEITDFATLPNNGPAFGNLNYDCVSQTIYVSNHEDGRIYQLDMRATSSAPTATPTRRHASARPTTPASPTASSPARRQRVWAVQSHAGRLYYSVWKEDTGRKTRPRATRSGRSATSTRAASRPRHRQARVRAAPTNNGQNYSNPVSDISFAATGWMLISQRTMLNDSQTTAHQSTTYEYQYTNGTWVLKGTTYIVGELPGSAAGGVDHDFEENGYVWMTGDALDFYTPERRVRPAGHAARRRRHQNSTLIDLDGELSRQQDKTSRRRRAPDPRRRDAGAARLNSAPTW